MRTKGQSEIVGFVLIVVLVVVAMMIFLVISASKPKEEITDVEVENMLSIISEYTTDCAPNYAPNYDTLGTLVQDCYDNKMCQNLNKSACSFLNQSLISIMGNISKAEANILAYQVKVLKLDNQSSEDLIVITSGNCTGNVRGAQDEVGQDLAISAKICYG